MAHKLISYAFGSQMSLLKTAISELENETHGATHRHAIAAKELADLHDAKPKNNLAPGSL